jgi:type I restriction enzyme M protein
MIAQDLKASLQALWDRFWAGGIANPLTAIEQISYLLFLRLLDAVETSPAVPGVNRSSVSASIFYDAPACRWSELKALPDDEMYEVVRNVAFPLMKRLGDLDGAFSVAMRDAVFVMEGPRSSVHCL